MRFLSQCIGLPVRDPAGEPLGSIADLIVAIGDKYPPVTGLVTRTDKREIFLPWRNVESMDDDGARLRVQTIDIGKFAQRPNEILLKQDLLDKQIVDIEGRKIIRVNDVSLDDIQGRLRLVAVDVGAAGLLRRLGIEGVFRTIARNREAARPRAVHRLGGRRPARGHHRQRPPPRPAREARGAPPGRPRVDHRGAGPTRPRRRPRLAQR